VEWGCVVMGRLGLVEGMLGCRADGGGGVYWVGGVGEVVSAVWGGRVGGV